MNKDSFYLVLTGKLLDGYREDEVLERLCRLLQLPETHVHQMLQGRPARIRKAVAKEKALRLMSKVIACGAGCEIEAVEVPAAAETQPFQPPQSKGQPQDEPISVSATLPKAQELDALPSDQFLALDLPEAGEPPEPLLSNPTEIVEEQPSAPQSPEHELLLEPVDEPGADDKVSEAGQPESQEELAANRVKTKDQPSDWIQDIQMGELPAWQLPSQSAIGQARLYEQPSTPSAEVPIPRKSSLLDGLDGRKRLLLGSGVLLVAAAWGGVQLLEEAPWRSSAASAVETARPSAPEDPLRAKTQERLGALAQSVRIWMIQYGSGFDPSQVTLERVQLDLQIPQQNMQDGWDNAFRYQVDEQRFALVSAGADRVFDTADDMRLRRSAR